jgi:hypothetical protein
MTNFNSNVCKIIAILVFTLCTNLKVSAQCSWTDAGISNFSYANYTSIAIDGSGTPYVVYQDISNKATVMKYNGSNWVTVGTAGFSAGEARSTSIAIDGSGTPYVVYMDGGNGSKATVMKFNGTSWVTVGTAGFSAGTAIYTSIAIDGSGTPYAVYRDGGNGSKATVMKYNGSSWVTVGAAGFSANVVDYTTIAIDGSGTPHVVCRDWANTNKATVLKFDGSSWVTVGTAGFSAGNANYTSIAIDGSGIPYVVYQDGGNANKATVMKYNGSSWAPVVAAGFSAGIADYTSIAIDGSGTPYVVYKDGANGTKATVKKFNGNSWETVGVVGFSLGTANYTSIAIDAAGTVYTIYTSNTSRASAKTWGKTATTATTQTITINAPFKGLFINNCNIIARVKPAGASPISGSTTAKVWIETTQPAQFVKRHYEITPATDATTATGSVTIYFTQAEFNDFNAVNAVKLPTGTADASGKANLLIEKFPGTSSDGTGLPNTYTGTPVTINPADANIVWNATRSRWEVSFDVTGFSGFFVKTISGTLPLHWLNVSGALNNNKQAVINFKVNETNVANYVVEKTTDNSNWTTVGTLVSKGNGVNNYQFTDAAPTQGITYYRIKQADVDGRFTYSSIIKLSNYQISSLNIYPNPVKDQVTISGAKVGSKLLLTDISGKLLQQITVTQTSFIVDMSKYNSGVYVLKTDNGITQKIIKE